MSRISKKQREFLEAVELCNRPAVVQVLSPAMSLPFYLGPDFAWDWDFYSEREARVWIEKLEQRGLITIEKKMVRSHH